MRQVGIVIGLTVILTFPVTVVSGAGSQKHFDSVNISPSLDDHPVGRTGPRAQHYILRPHDQSRGDRFSASNVVNR